MGYVSSPLAHLVLRFSCVVRFVIYTSTRMTICLSDLKEQIMGYVSSPLAHVVLRFSCVVVQIIVVVFKFVSYGNN